MTDHDDTRSLLETAEGPTRPDPAFAARLRAQLISGMAKAVAEQSPATRLITAVPKPPRAIRRHRWLDIAAAAVLLIGIIGALVTALLDSSSDRPTAVPATSAEDPPVMPYGSAARDGNYPGPAPGNEAYAVRWRDGTVNLDGSAPPVALPFGDVLYRFAGEGGIIATSLETNLVIWTAPPTSPHWSGAVTSAGVAVAIDDPAADPMDGPLTIRIVLLDLNTGEQLWQSRETYPAAINGFVQLLVSGDLILFQDEHAVVYALDLQTGQESWRHDPRDGQSADDILATYEPGDECSRRRLNAPMVAVTPGTTYLFDGITNQVTALDTATGARRWSIDAGSRTGRTADGVVLTAAEDGVLVTSCAYGGARGDLQPYLGLWSAADGTELWRSDLRVYEALTAGTGAVFVSYDTDSDPATCCALAELNLATGEVVWSDTSQTALPVGFVPAGDMLILRQPEIERTFAIDARTHEVIWDHTFLGCGAMLLPVTDDGAILCQADSGTLVLYEPTAPEMSPDAVTTLVATTAVAMATPETSADALAVSSIAEVTADSVNLRIDPAIDPDNVVAVLNAGDEVLVIAGPMDGKDGVTWYQVRDNRTALTGYIAADFIRAAE